MESWIQRVLLIGCAGLSWLASASSMAADTPELRSEPAVQPELDRTPVKLGAIDTEDFELGVYGGMLSIEDFGSDGVMGARLAYHIDTRFFFETAYGMSEGGLTSYEKLSGAARLLTDDERQYNYYNLSFGYNVLPGEAFLGRDWAFNTALYLIGGAGSTEFGGDDHFTLNFGAGYRFVLSDWMTLHLDARDHLFETDLLGESKTTHNLELTAGFTVFF